MSISYYVTLLRKNTDPEWQKKVAAVKALEEAGVKTMPPELADYFKMSQVSSYRVEESLKIENISMDYDVPKTKGIVRVSNDCSTTLTIDLDELPKDVKLIEVSLS